MPEYIFEIEDALYNEETSETVMKPRYKGRLTRCRDCAKNGTVNCAMADVNMDGEVVSWNEPDDHCSWGSEERQ